MRQPAILAAWAAVLAVLAGFMGTASAQDAQPVPAQEAPAQPQLAQAQPGAAPQPGARQPRPPVRPPQGRPPARGQLPPGHPPLRQAPPPPPPPAPAEDAHDDGHKAHYCPGHGPLDKPHHINWYQGILGVDNEKSQSDNFVDRLLWRYENKDDPCDEKNQQPPFAALILNFGIFAFIVSRLARKPIKDALRKRKTDLMEGIESAAKLRDEAEQRLEEYEDRFDKLDSTLKKLKKSYVDQGERDKKRILAEAEERRERMQKDAAFRIDQERKEMQNQLVREATHEAVEAAEELLKKSITAADMERIAEDYLKQIGPALRDGTTASPRRDA